MSLLNLTLPSHPMGRLIKVHGWVEYTLEGEDVRHRINFTNQHAITPNQQHRKDDKQADSEEDASQQRPPPSLDGFVELKKERCAYLRAQRKKGRKRAESRPTHKPLIHTHHPHTNIPMIKGNGVHELGSSPSYTQLATSSLSTSQPNLNPSIDQQQQQTTVSPNEKHSNRHMNSDSDYGDMHEICSYQVTGLPSELTQSRLIDENINVPISDPSVSTARVKSNPLTSPNQPCQVQQEAQDETTNPCSSVSHSASTTNVMGTDASISTSISSTQPTPISPKKRKPTEPSSSEIDANQSKKKPRRKTKATDSSPMDSDLDDDEWPVHKIVSHRVRGGQDEYLVHWCDREGHQLPLSQPSSRTWQLKSDLTGCQELVEEYVQQVQKAKQAKPKQNNNRNVHIVIPQIR